MKITLIFPYKYKPLGQTRECKLKTTLHYHIHLKKTMSYRANLIRASKGSDGSRDHQQHAVEAPPMAPQQTPPEPHLPQLPQSHIYYALRGGSPVRASLTTGIISGHLRRLSQNTRWTCSEIVRRSAKWGRRRHSTTSIFFDKFSAAHDWLPNGWIAERRIVLPDNRYWVKTLLTSNYISFSTSSFIYS